MGRGRAVVAALAGGGVLALAFPKPGLHPLAWLALVPLLLAVRGRDAWRAWLLGMGFGLVLRAGTLYWLTHAMTRFGGLSWPLALLATGALAAYLALYQGAFAVVAARTELRDASGAVLLAATWTGLEMLQGILFSGFPWALLGYAGGGWAPLLQVADVAGVWGLGFLVVLVNVALAALVLHGRSGLRPAALAGLAVALAVGYGSFRLATAPPAPTGRLLDAAGTASALPEGPGGSLDVGVVQGNVSQDRKWDPASRAALVDRHLELSRRAMEAGADLVVWPESSWPDPLGVERDIDARRRIGELAADHGAGVLVGSVHVDDDGEVANAAVLFGPDGGLAGRYDKVHLVPFGEYLPLRDWLPDSLGPLVQAVGALRPGEAEQRLLGEDVEGLPRLGLAICYEIVFPGLVRRGTERGAELLVTITNDAWYGTTSGPYQHYSMARFRAVENRRWLVRAANTGISGIIDPWGREASRSRLDTRAVLVAGVRPGSARAPYLTIGDSLGRVCAVIAVVALALALRGRRRSPRPDPRVPS